MNDTEQRTPLERIEIAVEQIEMLHTGLVEFGATGERAERIALMLEATQVLMENLLNDALAMIDPPIGQPVTPALAHADGRHESTHPADRMFWRNAGCPDCRVLYDENGLPRNTQPNS